MQRQHKEVATLWSELRIILLGFGWFWFFLNYSSLCLLLDLRVQNQDLTAQMMEILQLAKECYNKPSESVLW